MTKIEVIYEKLAAYGRSVNEDDVMTDLHHSLQLLDINRRYEDFLKDPDYVGNMRMSISDVVYHLLLIASKRGLCLECMADDLEIKLEFAIKKQAGFTFVVPPPTVINTDNTGPEIK